MDSGGQIVWNLNVESSKFNASMASAKEKVDAFATRLAVLDKSSLGGFGARIGSIGDSVVGFGNRIESAGQKLNSMGSSINRIAAPAALALGAGLGYVSKMAFDQVSSVQQATLALKAYEKDGNKVNQVLGDLLAYARSDLGVLFNRKDLFAAAQGLKIMGDDTSKLTDHVKIMSRAVGLGTTNWEDLSSIVGRVGSTGRLTGVDFDNLAKAGFKLDTNLRNTDITFEELFKHLDKGIPIDALNGQADSIKGIGVRVQTAFRGIGEAILGVDKDTGQFIKGGAGDQLNTFFKNLPNVLNEPKLKEAFKNIGQSIADFAQNALPKIISFIEFVGRNIETIVKVSVALVAFGTSMKLIGSFMSAVSTGITLVGGAIKGLSAALTFFAANPVVLAATAAVALTAAVLYLGKSIYDTSVKTGSATQAIRTWQFAALTVINPTIALGAAVFALAGQSHAAAAAHDRVTASQNAVKLSSDALKTAQDNLTGASLGVERAQRSYNDAVAQYGPQSLEAREANYNLGRANDAVTKAAEEAKNKEQEKANKEQELAKSKEFENSIRNTSFAFVDQGGIIDSVIGKIYGYAQAAGSALSSVTSSAQDTINKFNAAKGIPGHAKGIMNSPGGLAIVGEKGPELVNLPKGSDVFSNETSRRMASPISGTALSGASGRTQSNQYHIGTINIANEVDGQRWLEKLTRDQEVVSNGLVPSRGAV